VERWEYKIISSKELMAHKELEEQLNKFGEEGWGAGRLLAFLFSS
jgi:hypothetical protein